MTKGLPQRFAILLPSLKFGGAERVVLTLAQTLSDLGIHVDILLMSKEGELLPAAESRFNVIDLECSRTYKLPAKLMGYLARNKPDVLLSSFWKLNLCSCLAKMFMPGLQLMLWEHSPPSRSLHSPAWLYAPSASIFYRWAHRVIAVSTGVRQDIDRLTVGLRGRLIVIFNPIAPPAILPRQPRLEGKARQVIWVGRLDSPKNPELMLEAFSLLPPEINAELVFVGDGILRSSLMDRCATLGLQDRVRFAGYLPDPYEVMVTSDLLVLSSDREGLPSVLVEALYCGLRVVSTDCGEGVHDILLDDRYGTIVAPRDPAALAGAIASELAGAPSHAYEVQMQGAERFLPREIVQRFLAECQ